MDARLKGLIEKLKALSDRGIGGEKDNAAQKLRDICDKYDIPIDQIFEDEKEVDNQFYLSTDPIIKRLFAQVASTVLGNNFSSGTYVYKKARKPGYERSFITCKVSDFVEIMAKYEFFERGFKDDLDIFFKAFISKNSIYPNVNDPIEKDFTLEERQEAFKIANMAAGLDKRNYNKQLEDGSR